MNKLPEIAILAGGVGPEREVSLSSGQALCEALSASYAVRMLDLTEERLPEDLDPRREVVFPVIHGTFGEDGRLQSLLEDLGLEYAGSRSGASKLCMNKVLAKKVVSASGVRVSAGIDFTDPEKCDADKIISSLGREIVLKPIDQGSSVFLRMTSGQSDLKAALSELQPGEWMIERRIIGREVTIGMLDGHAMGIVEVIPVGGVYDFERKYQPGATQYRFPAILDDAVERERALRPLLVDAEVARALKLHPRPRRQLCDVRLVVRNIDATSQSLTIRLTEVEKKGRKLINGVRELKNGR